MFFQHSVGIQDTFLSITNCNICTYDKIQKICRSFSYFIINLAQRNKMFPLGIPRPNTLSVRKSSKTVWISSQSRAWIGSVSGYNSRNWTTERDLCHLRSQEVGHCQQLFSCFTKQFNISQTFLISWVSTDCFLRNVSQTRHPNKYQVRRNEFLVLAV